MINFMLGQVEHEIGRVCLRAWVLYAAVSWKASSVLLLVYALIGGYVENQENYFQLRSPIWGPVRSDSKKLSPLFSIYEGSLYF